MAHTTPVLTTMLASETANPLVIVVLVGFGGLGWWNGLKTWRGEEPARFARHAAQHGQAWTLMGTRRQYQSRVGMGHVGLMVGPAFVLVGVGEGVRALLGQERDWWLFSVVAIVAMALLVVGVVYAAAYSFTGVPDRLRPPCQRGWEIVDGELQLVRPEAFHEHPKHSSAQGDQPAGYDPWR